MDGEVVHEWSHGEDSWEHVELLAGGEILVLVNDKRLFKLDRDSNLLWTLEGRFHHDLWVRPNGEIYVLFRRAVRVTAIHDELDVFEDQVLILGPDGARRDAISLLDVLQKSQFGFLLPSLSPTWDGAEDGGALDVLHANHVEVMDGRLQHLNPLFAAGNLLISVRNINAIFILDGRSRDVLWLWGPTNLTFQHHPTLLENGNILVFDNGIKRSRVLEVELRSRRIVWQYEADHFFSAKRGSNQRLPNGNTLITESDAGYVFEVTRSGEIVWEFANPNISDTEERRAIWRMTRLPASSLDFRPE